MKRKNLKVGLRVEMKATIALTAGEVGIVYRVEPDDYVGDFPCSVLFEGCDTAQWVEVSQIRIADKVRKVTPAETAPRPDVPPTEPLDARHTIRLPASVKAKAQRIGAAAVIAAIVAAEDVA